MQKQNQLFNEKCNPQAYTFDGQDSELFIIIGLYSVLGLCLFIFMCRLCAKVFSYSNFHIHEAYKFYTFALISTTLIILFRIAQLIYNDKKHQVESQKLRLPPPLPQKNLLRGYSVISLLIGITYKYSLNFTYLFNAFTWLIISFKCDTIKEQQQKKLESLSEMPTLLRLQKQKKKYRDILKLLKRIFLYILNPILLCSSLLLALDQSDILCQISQYLILFSQILSFVIFTVSTVRYIILKIQEKSDKKIIFILGYVPICLLAYMIFFIASFYNTKIDGWLILLIQIFFNIPSFVCMIYMSEIQLKKQQCNILKNSDVLMFSNTII